MQYYFDLTTSGKWRGRPVGIIRVERELARRAKLYLGANASYCIYDKSSSNFIAVKDSAAQRILDGKGALASPSWSSVVLGNIANWANNFKSWPDWIVRDPSRFRRTYRWFSKLTRRPRINRLQVEMIRMEVLAGKHDQPRPLDEIPFADWFDRVIDLNADVTIMSAGLDWTEKDMRAHYLAKQKTGFRYIAVVYDLIPILLPHFLVPQYVDLLWDYFCELQWVADQVLCISAVTRKNWIEFTASWGNDFSDRAHVFSLGSDIVGNAKADSAPLPKEINGRQFAMYVSTIEPRKNHRVIYEAWEYCIKNRIVNPDKQCLVFVGMVGWNTAELLHEIRHNPYVKNSIVILNNVDDEQLDTMYRSCAFSLFPSHSEGYGLAAVESMAHGKVCVIADTPALVEISRDLNPVVHPRDVFGWANVIGRLMNHPEVLREMEREIISKFVPSTWDNSASTFFKIVGQTCER